MKTVGIVQSNYIPWKGYFDLIRSCDEFILYDDAQFTKRDWRNRNQLKTPQGLQWLSIPVIAKGRFHQKICETVILEPEWGESHWRTIQQNFSRAPHFGEYRSHFETLYLESKSTSLSEVNFRFIEKVCALLSISTKITWSMDYKIEGESASLKLLNLVLQAGGTRYISGPLAKDYLETPKFREAGIEVGFFDYSGYPEYPQLYGPFVHGVTVLDLLFNTGKDAVRFLDKSNISRVAG